MTSWKIASWAMEKKIRKKRNAGLTRGKHLKENRIDTVFDDDFLETRSSRHCKK